MCRFILLFAFVTTVLLTSTFADPTTPEVDPAKTQEAVASEAQPMATDAASANDTSGAEFMATSPDTATDATAVPAETK